VAASLPKLHLPVTVTTDGVDAGLSAVERKARAAAGRIAAINARAAKSAGAGTGAGAGIGKAATASALGIGGFGAIGGVAGALGTTGAGIAVGLAPFIAAGKLMSVFNEATKGANDALKQFNETGSQVFAANSAILERLAIMESTTARQMGLGKAFVAAGASTGGQPGGLFGWAREFSNGMEIIASAIGAAVSGKTASQIANEMALGQANEGGAPIIAARIREQQRIDEATGTAGALSRPLSALADWAVQNSSLAQYLLKASI
jgi:hypothetical protein